jgi:gluconate kinase
MISGISGTGKTTIGKMVAKYKNWTFIDQDSFYLQEKPLIMLSLGIKVKNWDCIESIDWHKLNNEVKKTLQLNNVLLVGFALWSSYISFPVEKHIHLFYGTGIDNDIILCYFNRKESKNLTNDNILKDISIIKELVFPFYFKTLENSIITHYIRVYNENIRIDIDKLLTHRFASVDRRESQIKNIIC